MSILDRPPAQGQVPEALRLAALLDETPDFAVDPNMVDDLAAELRRQHARIAELEEAQLESIGAGVVGGPLMGASLAANAGSESVMWKHDRAALLTNDVELWIDACPHCGKPRDTAPPTAQAEGWVSVDEAYKQVLWSKNCMQCCVGYMLGLPLESVPDFAADGGWDRFASFAESQGYAAVMLPGTPEFEADYLASGTTARGTSHMVVMNDGKLVHDPHPSNAGLVEVQCVWLLAKKAGPQWHHDERAAFEASAKAFTSNVSFERDGTDYADMTASLLRHGWKLRAARASAESVLEDAARLDFIERHPEMSLRHRKGRWAFLGFTNYEYDLHQSLREAIDAARKQGGA